MKEFKLMAAGNQLVIEDRRLSDNSTVYDIGAMDSDGYYIRLFNAVTEKDAFECWHKLNEAYTTHCVV